MDENIDVEVIHEEIIVHPSAERRWRKSWKGTARVMGTVVIAGEMYRFERVIQVLFVRANKAQEG